MTSPPPLLERYRDLLARPGEAFPVTLGEGGTPLIHAARLGERLGLDRLYLKFEGTNPTGSFKDRGMVLAVNRAVAGGARAVVCASTGNTSASAAAYAAAAGIRCLVVLPAGKVARGKLAQALAAGARLVMVEGNFDEALTAVRELGASGEAVVVNSINPDRLEGQQTVAWEICRRARWSAGRRGAPGGQRRQHHRRLARASRSTPTRGGPLGGARGCSASRRRARRPSWEARRWPLRRRWPPPSGSATLPRGTGPRPPATSPAG